MNGMTQTQTTSQNVNELYNSLFKTVDNVQKYVAAQTEKIDSIVNMNDDNSESIKNMLSNWHGVEIETVVMYNEGFRTIVVFMDKNHDIHKAYFSKVLNSQKRTWIYGVDKNAISIHVLRWTIRHCRRVADHWNRAIVQIGV